MKILIKKILREELEKKSNLKEKITSVLDQYGLINSLDLLSLDITQLSDILDLSELDIIKNYVEGLNDIIISDEKIMEKLKTAVFKYSLPLDIDKVSEHITFWLLYRFCWPDDDERDKLCKKIKFHLSKVIKKEYSKVIEDFYNQIFKEDEKIDLCFIQKSTSGSRFVDCYDSWFELLKEKGIKLPNLDWNKVKERLKTESEILLAKPGEGHTYDYYFYIIKKSKFYNLY